MKAQTLESAQRRIETAVAHYTKMIEHEAPRFAVIRGARSVKEAVAYLPGNYDLMESFEVLDNGTTYLWIVIGGYDNAGWSLDGYVIPRLASGLMGCEEIS
jgi:hypothetical protein